MNGISISFYEQIAFIYFGVFIYVKIIFGNINVEAAVVESFVGCESAHVTSSSSSSITNQDCINFCTNIIDETNHPPVCNTCSHGEYGDIHYVETYNSLFNNAPYYCSLTWQGNGIDSLPDATTSTVIGTTQTGPNSPVSSSSTVSEQTTVSSKPIDNTTILIGCSVGIIASIVTVGGITLFNSNDLEVDTWNTLTDISSPGEDSFLEVEDLSLSHMSDAQF